MNDNTQTFLRPSKMFCCSVFPWKEAHPIVREDIFLIIDLVKFSLYISSKVFSLLPFSLIFTLQFFTCFFFCLKQGGEINLRTECEDCKIKVLPYSLKPPSTQATYSYAEKPKAITWKALNETMLLIRKKNKNEKKNLTVLHKAHEYSPQFLT